MRRKKYLALKQLADSFKNGHLDIVMVCSGLASKYQKFIIHAEANNHKGITFLYDSDSISLHFCKGGISSFPMEFLYHGQDEPQLSFIGFDKDINDMYLIDEIKKIKKLYE